jgi:hypothetical protein
MSPIVKFLKKADATGHSVRLHTPEIMRLIAEKAYSLWEQRGRPNGNDLQDWLEAEKLVRFSLS